MSSAVVGTSLSSRAAQNRCKCLLPAGKSDAKRAFIVQQGYEGVGWGEQNAADSVATPTSRNEQ